MAREKKAQVIDELQDIISRSSVGVLTDYRGLTHAEMTDLRRRIQQAGGDFRVVKNTLARFAATRADREELAGAFEGPVALAVGYDDITQIAKVIAGYIRETRLEISIKGGFTAERVLTAAEVNALSTLPPREVLVAQLLAQLNSPVYRLVNVLSGPMRGLVGVLQAQIKQMEEA